MSRKRFAKVAEEVKYPSATLLQSACYNDYKDLLDRYNRMYEKINIALSLCGAIVLVILGSFDYTILFKLGTGLSSGELFFLLVHISCALVSSVLVVWSVVQLLLLARSRNIAVFDSVSIRNDEIYRRPEDQASVWLIKKYTDAIFLLRKIVHEKQREFDSVLIKLVISVITYSVVVITKKGF